MTTTTNHLVKPGQLDLRPILGLPALLQMNTGELNAFIAQTHCDSDVAHLCMQMFYVLMALGQDDFALDMQAKALVLGRTYRIAGSRFPRIRLLALMGPGNMLDNTPLDFVVEHSSIQLDLLYLFPNGDFPALIPEHDIAIVAVGESEKNAPLLASIEAMTERWPRKILNPAANVRHCARVSCYHLLKDIPQLVFPKTRRTARHEQPALTYPMTIRPVDTHGGNGLMRLDNPDALQAYFEQFPAETYYTAEYIDYQSKDGYFRKIRLVLIDGNPYICHLAISDSWIVHYLSADMAVSVEKRAEEAFLMSTFEADFAVRFEKQISAMVRLLGLDYVTIDCAELADGRLLVFEVDTRGLIHAADPIDVYPYKPAILQKAFDAFEGMLASRIERS